ncbi:MAG: ABC transporter ATP-binding protein [Thermoflexus sp.]|uniref:ABC transporter ATP-binding protein n=1 Tax=Thermoflexus sp. TaxID=1969742 RepID=UPI0025DF449F|nr:ABC transporter ATP-binding protein [Thermoflexus sp.]MCS6963398.1 ABC transporter ATP-binding protein [Thermoflexus sp.]MDW8065218.1 ABC transporter ATP-binding protein [Anaerolineae bacterium]MDW8186295.1 ABC transporter ATP-binding protein [Anaerolineae bacterium]
MALLEVRDLTKDFGGLRAVNRCSFTVEQGSITALIGPNGAGKTTVFNLITGLLRPTSGRIYFQGRDITAMPPHRIARLGIARTFQITRELAELTVLENVVVHAIRDGLAGLIRSSILQHEAEQAMALLEFVGLAALAHEKAGKLSYGQRKLMELAGALMANPQMIMLDEPAAGVNPALLEEILERILQLNRSGMTFLIIEHNMDVVMNLSHQVVVMAHGEVICQGTPETIQQDPRVLDAYLGAA